MDNKDAYIMHLESTIQDLQNQISNLNEIVLLLRKEKFGSSSEKTPKEEFDGQLSLFNEAEVEADASLPEPIVKDAKGYKRRNTKTKREELIKDLPIREVPCTYIIDSLPQLSTVVRNDFFICIIDVFNNTIPVVFFFNCFSCLLSIKIYLFRRINNLHDFIT
ncbi:Transposase C of IS166 homeodomain protein [Clostridium sp. C105KSO15]|nr:Transposase C of IS166 homeodomain protein [Clostridium sp. C105KSO15]